jgi:pantoate--beta-alanine ligase
MVRPLRSYFGEKDFQQLAMIRRLQSDLSLPGEIVGCPTVRDADGLALSSRNARLSVAERSSARAIPEVLFSIRDRVNDGDRASAKLIEIGRSILARQPLLTIDYLAIVNSTTLLPTPVVGIDARALVAVHAGATRLIDNIDLSGDAKLS